MWLFVGLGNPGSTYQRNRHNIGFMAVDEIVRRHKFSAPEKKFQGCLHKGVLAGQTVFILKPETFMNLSGQSVQAVMQFYKIPLDHVVVFHDELDLAEGKVRTKFSGGAAGHNGLRSIDQHLGQDYWRVRLGIGHPGDKDRVSDYVLGDFFKTDQAWLDPLINAIGQHAEKIVEKDMDGFMTRVAEEIRPPRENKKKE